MKRCGQSLEVLSAFVDGELAEAEELAVRRHLEGCGECAHRIAALDALKRAVARSSELHPLPRTLKESLRVPPRRRHRWVVGVFATLAAAVALLIGAALWISRGASGPRPEPSLLDDLVKDHRRYARSPNAVEYATGDRNLLARWFSSHLGYPIRLPELADARVVGGRTCSLRGHKAALAFYEFPNGGGWISVYAMPAGTLPPNERAELMRSAGPGPANSEVCRDHGNDYRLCFRPEGNLEIVMVEPKRDGAPDA